MDNILRLSEASNLAIHALAYMAGVGVNQPVSASLIGKDLHVSESHLSKVLQLLAREGMIQSTRGARGGFFFNYDPSDITLLEIVEAVDGKVKGGACLLGNPICKAKTCRLRTLSASIADLVREELANVKLVDLAISNDNVSFLVNSHK